MTTHRFLRLLCGLALLLACARPASAQDTRQFGGIVYPVQGWDPAIFETFVGLNAPADGTRYLVLPSEATTTALDVWLEATAARFHEAEGATVIQEETLDTFPSVQGYPATARFVQARRTSRVTRYGLFIGVRVDDRNYAVAVQARSLEELQQHTGGFAAWLEALRFEGADAVALTPSPGPLHGTYAGVQIAFRGLDSVTEVVFYTFSREGWAYTDIPEGAPAGLFDFQAAALDAPDEVGTYQARGGTLTLTYADRSTDEWALAIEGRDAIELDGITFARLETPPDGARLSGRYRFGSYTTSGGTLGAEVLVAASLERDYTFTPAGRFETTEASFASATSARAVAASGRVPAPVTGTYVVQNGQLVLTADDGTVARKSLFRFGDEGLIIAGEPYYPR